VAALFALGVALAGNLFSRRRPTAAAPDQSSRPDAAAARIPSGVFRDVLFGAAAALTVAGTLGVYGRAAGGGAGGVLALAGVGLLISALWRFAFTGRLSTPAELFQDAFWTGLLAATSSAQELWQAPGDWMMVLQKSRVTAALAFLVYHVANACALSSLGRHLRPISGALIVGTPYLFGWLLTLQNGALAGGLAGFAGGHAALGRFLIVYLFNEAVANAIALAAGGRGVKTARAHGLTALVSAAVVAAPWVADLGSSAAAAALPAGGRAAFALVTAALSQAGLWAEVYLVTGMILDGIHGFAPTAESMGRHAATGGRKGAAYSGILVALIWGMNLLFGTDAWRAPRPSRSPRPSSRPSTAACPSSNGRATATASPGSTCAAASRAWAWPGASRRASSSRPRARACCSAFWRALPLRAA
jgi:cyclic beta-1,2-glucan synthetase